MIGKNWAENAQKMAQFNLILNRLTVDTVDGTSVPHDRSSLNEFNR